MKEWLQQQQRGKAAKAEREAREKEMKLRGEKAYLQDIEVTRP